MAIYVLDVLGWKSWYRNHHIGVYIDFGNEQISGSCWYILYETLLCKFFQAQDAFPQLLKLVREEDLKL